MPLYAGIEDGGKQYRVEVGAILDVEKKPLAVGAPVEFDRVLLAGDGENVRVGFTYRQDAERALVYDGFRVDARKPLNDAIVPLSAAP